MTYHPNKPMYAAVVDAMDQAIGQVLATLDREGSADNTIVLFFSDNGGAAYSVGGASYPIPLARHREAACDCRIHQCCSSGVGEVIVHCLGYRLFYRQGLPSQLPPGLCAVHIG